MFTGAAQCVVVSNRIFVVRSRLPSKSFELFTGENRVQVQLRCNSGRSHDTSFGADLLFEMETLGRRFLHYAFVVCANSSS